MAQIAMIILAVMGLCGVISVKTLSIGILIAVGIQILAQVINTICKKKLEEEY